MRTNISIIHQPWKS